MPSWAEYCEAFLSEMKVPVDNDTVRSLDDVTVGLDNAPETFIRMLEGVELRQGGREDLGQIIGSGRAR